MRDIIDERNEKERISRSIVKFWNVNYVVKPPRNDADEESRRLAAEDAQMNEEAYMEEQNQFYNPTTGSYSGKYGRGEIKDEVTQGQIDKILHEKSDALRNLISHSDEESHMGQ